jgi:hypothetical protein
MLVPGTNGVDAFAFDWSSDNNWIVPPVSLVCKAINHMFLCKAKGVLVLPKWKSALLLDFYLKIIDTRCHV